MIDTPIISHLESTPKAHFVTISPQFQIELPISIRESLAIQPGQQFQMILYENRLLLIPFKPMRQLRGFLKGIDTTIQREGDRL